MKIGMCMFLWSTSVSEDQQGLLEDIKEVGFDGVEIPVFVGQPDDYARLGRMLNRIGLERTAVAAISDPAKHLVSANTCERDAGIKHVEWAIDCAEALGASILCGPLHSTLGYFSGEGPTSDELKRLVDVQRQIGEHASRRHVTVALEALNRFECYLVNTMDDLSRQIDEIGHPRIKAMYDTFHANIEETEPVQAFTRNLRNIVHVHISENDRGVPGRGNLPWQETFAAICSSGYDGWLTIEAFGRSLRDLAAATKVWRDLAESPEAVYRDGYRHIRACISLATAGRAAPTIQQSIIDPRTREI